MRNPGVEAALVPVGEAGAFLVEALLHLVRDVHNRQRIAHDAGHVREIAGDDVIGKGDKYDEQLSDVHVRI